MAVKTGSRTDVCQRLADESAIDPSDVSVEMKDGKVTLAGSLPDRGMKYRIEDIIESRSGVRDMDNRLWVSRGGAGGLLGGSAMGMGGDARGDHGAQKEEGGSHGGLQGRLFGFSGGTRLADFMTCNPRTLMPEETLRKVAQLMKDEDVGSIPVCTGRKLTGMITDRDIVIRAVAAGALSTAALAARGRIETRSVLTPTNAASHWLWDDRAARRDGASLKYTAAGYLIHQASALLWATVYGRYVADRAGRRGPVRALVTGSAAAALAVPADYRPHAEAAARGLRAASEHRSPRGGSVPRSRCRAAGPCGYVQGGRLVRIQGAGDSGETAPRALLEVGPEQLGRWVAVSCHPGRSAAVPLRLGYQGWWRYGGESPRPDLLTRLMARADHANGCLLWVASRTDFETPGELHKQAFVVVTGRVR